MLAEDSSSQPNTSHPKNTNNVNDGVPACFFFADTIDRSTPGFLICREIEKVTGKGTIVGVQKLRGLYRVYTKTLKVRNMLLSKGFSVNGVFIALIDTNPRSGKRENEEIEEKENIRIIVGNLPYSISPAEIRNALSEVEGVELRSPLYDETYRDDNGFLTLFKTGRRFVYAVAPSKPIQHEFKVGHWTASIYYKGQPKKQKNVEERSKTNYDVTEHGDNTPLDLSDDYPLHPHLHPPFPLQVSRHSL